MLLAIDTATRMMSLALFDGETILADYTHYSANQHTVQLTQTIDFLLKTQGIPVDTLQALAIAQGVGSYSGLRVGFGVAKGLATARNIPLIGVPTLELIAASVPRFDGVLYPIIPAGRKRILTQAYHWSDGWQVLPNTRYWNTTWDEFFVECDTPTIIHGEIPSAIRQQVTEIDRPIRLLPLTTQTGRASLLAVRAWGIYQGGQFPKTVNPIYAKEP